MACVAAQEGHDACARLLLESGAAVNQPSLHGVTPLYTAAQEAQTDCVRLLLDAGAAVIGMGSNLVVKDIASVPDTPAHAKAQDEWAG